MTIEHVLPRTGIFRGMITGDARVVSGSDVHVRGMISGDLIVEPGSTVVVSGMIGGTVVNQGADVTADGMIGYGRR